DQGHHGRTGDAGLVGSAPRSLLSRRGTRPTLYWSRNPAYCAERSDQSSHHSDKCEPASFTSSRRSMIDAGATFIHSAGIGCGHSEKYEPDGAGETVLAKIAVGAFQTPAPSTLMPIFAPSTWLSRSSPPTMFFVGYHG